MAQGYARELLGVLDGGKIPPGMLDGRQHGARVRGYIATLDLSQSTVARANGDTNVLFDLPAGEKPFIVGTLGSVTMGTNATVAIGIAGTPGKYRAAATHTATTLQLAMLSSALDDAPLAAKERVVLTVGHADGLPSSGILQVFILTLGR